LSYWEKVNLYWNEVSIYDGEEVFLSQFSRLPQTCQTLFAAHWLQSEVNNGGFFQFFQNDTGILAPEAVFALKELGMPKCASIVEKAMSPYGQLYPRSAEAREHSPDECWDWDFLDSLSAEFHVCISNENGGFEAAANHYALANA
jgi:hypothetical protein